MCETQDKNKTLELLRCLRQKRVKRLHILSSDLEYLKRLDLDREDAKVQKEVAHRETSIAKSKINYESVKFLNGKVIKSICNIKITIIMIIIIFGQNLLYV